MSEMPNRCPACGGAADCGSETCVRCGQRIALPLETESVSGEAPAEMEPATTSAGGVLAGFRILRKIGSGGAGVVYEAEQTSMRRRVALKVLDAGLFPSDNEVSRFEREAWIAGRLNHPNVIKVYGQGTEGSSHWIAMELVEGRSLHEWIVETRRQRLEQSTSSRSKDRIRQMVALFVGVTEALHYVHQQKIVHRDIKPLNLLFTNDKAHLLLTDFGLARDEAASRMTRRGDLLGTILYMSPEQLLASRARIDHRSDIWSLGVSLYEAVTLSLPYSGETEEAYLTAITTKAPLPARNRDRAVPRDLETILMKCMERDPERRYRSAAALKEDLVRFLEDKPVAARRTWPIVKLVRRSWHHRRVITAVGVTAGALAVVLGTAFVIWILRLSPGFLPAKSTRGFGVVTGTLPVEQVRGKKVRYAGWIRTKDLQGGFAGLWWRVDGPEGVLAFDNMQDRGPKGTTDWTRGQIDLEVAPEATNINFGVIMPGQGMAWFDDLTIEVDGAPYNPGVKFDLDFESDRVIGFYAGQGGVIYQNRAFYRCSLSRQNPRHGMQCLQMEYVVPGAPGGFGVATGTFPVESARGKKVRYTGWIRTKDLKDGYAGLWWRVDGPAGVLAFDNMEDRGPNGTTDWTLGQIDLEVPSSAKNINFGVLMPGQGKAWFDDLAIELDGAPYEPGKEFDFDFESDRVIGFSLPKSDAYRGTLSTESPRHGTQCLGIEWVANP